MRKLAPFLLLLALFALPALASEYTRIIIRDGDRHYVDGDTDETRFTGLGREYVYFVRDGVAYAITDGSILARVRKIVKPQADLGEQQAKLGEQQAALGAKQAELGAKQAELGARQAAAAGNRTRSHELAERQRELGRRQRELGEQQRPLGEQQRILGAKQREAAREARRQFETLFDEAIRTGVAKRH